MSINAYRYRANYNKANVGLFNDRHIVLCVKKIINMFYRNAGKIIGKKYA